MISRNDAYLFLLEVDRELAEDLGEEPLATVIAEEVSAQTPASAFSRIKGFARRGQGVDLWALVRENGERRTVRRQTRTAGGTVKDALVQKQFLEDADHYGVVTYGAIDLGAVEFHEHHADR